MIEDKTNKQNNYKGRTAEKKRKNETEATQYEKINKNNDKLL